MTAGPRRDRRLTTTCGWIVALAASIPCLAVVGVFVYQALRAAGVLR